MTKKEKLLHSASNMTFPMNNVSLFLVLILSSLVSFGSSTGETSKYSGFYSPTKRHAPYEWSYMRIELPENFSSATIVIGTDVNLNLEKLHEYSKESLPIICFRDGGPPLPDFSRASLRDLVINHYNVSDGNVQYLRNVDQCYPLQKRVTFKIAYGEFVPGVYYAGLFNGLGDFRNQPDMQTKSGSAYSFRANVTVEACVDPTKRGQYCDQTVENLGDMEGSGYKYTRRLCLVNTEPKIYSLPTGGPIQMTVKAENIRLNHTLPVGSGLSIMCHARSNGVADEFLYDYSYDLIKSSIVMPATKGDNWYFTMQAVFEPNLQNERPEEDTEVCLSVDWEVMYCPKGKDGPNCESNGYLLQDNGTWAFLPEGKNESSNSLNFTLEPLLSKSLHGEKSGYAWTYFFMWAYTTGTNIHIQLTSEKELDHEIYVRYNGLPTSEVWDYRYANRKLYGEKNSLFKLYDSTRKKVNLFLLYAREGLWLIGLKHPLPEKTNSNNQTTMSVHINSCPNRCSDHGTCYRTQELSGSTSFCYCSCGQDRGGFDCSVNLRPKWHSVLLVASNAVAFLPAFRALQQKEYPEGMVFMTSGIASAIYHNCDEHRHCVLQFRVLQFMDFWLSFLAVVSTFMYLTNVSHFIKRTLHTIAAIITALLAANNPTWSSNIQIVFALGATGLLIGWLTELSKRNKPFSFHSTTWSQNPERWGVVKLWFFDLFKQIYRYFRWVYLLLGFIALAMAGLSRKMEGPLSYWKWHSLWHVSVFACPFFFLCAKASKRNGDIEEASETTSYELAETQEISKDEEDPKVENGKSRDSKLDQL